MSSPVTELANNTAIYNGIETEAKSNQSGNPCLHEHETEDEDAVLHIVTFVGAAVSIFGILLTLLSYIGFRKFQVKRTHIVMVNLCICLLVYFVAFLLSNAHRSHAGHCDEKQTEPLCIAGAFMGHLAMLSSWFWIGAYWFVLLMMYQRPMGGHISHFFFKAAVPSYGMSFLIALICILVSRVKKPSYNNEMCFIDGNYLRWGLLMPFALAFIPIFVIFIYVLRGMLSKEQSPALQRVGNAKRVKIHLIKLSVITLLIALMILGSLIVPVVKDTYAEHNLVSVVLFTIVSTSLGVLLMVLFCLHQDEMRHHWVEVLSGKKHPIHHNSLSRMKYDAAGGSYGSSRKSSTLTNRQPSLFVDPPEEDLSRKSSRIIPKEDTDMTTLGLIQIPGTPSPSRGFKKEIVDPEHRNSTLQPIDENRQLRANQDGEDKEEKSERNSLLIKIGDDKKRRSDSNSSTTSRGKAKKSKRQKSQDQMIVSKPSEQQASNKRKEFKRRSFSTSSITEGLHLSKKKRESTISTDSTAVTNFA